MLDIHTHLLVDLFSTSASSLIVSPFVTILDQAVSCNASGKRDLHTELKSCSREFIQHPLKFCKSPAFLWVWALYAGTYAAHNITETLCVSNDVHPTTPKFVSASVVNMSMVLAKDRAFARMFGTIVPTNLSLTTYVLFACRDLFTVFASFSLPEKIAARQGGSEKTLKSAQMFCPLAIQFVSTPLHLIGLDLYNRKMVSISDRMNMVKTQYWKTALMRSARIIPAFSLGSLCNGSIRNSLKQ